MRRALRKRRVFDFVPSYLKEYPKNLLSAIRLAREADETVQRLSSMDTQTTVGHGRNEQVPSTADGETSRHDQRGQKNLVSEEDGD